MGGFGYGKFALVLKTWVTDLTCEFQQGYLNPVDIGASVSL
jgi:hypothetical protein